MKHDHFALSNGSLVRPKLWSSRIWFYSFGAALLLFVFAPRGVLGIDPNLGRDVGRRISEFRDQLAGGGAIDKRKMNEALQVAALLAIIDDESKPGGNHTLKHRALRELERFPDSDEAIAVLLREIRFEPPKVHSRNPLATYTAADVLSKMSVRARTRLFSGLSKPLSEPELYLRGVVLVKMDEHDGEWKLGKEIALKRLGHLLAVAEKVPPPGETANSKNAIIFNLKRMISLIEDPSFSAGRIPDPDEPQK